MATKKTIKENPITTFRKNFENRSKTFKSSLKKANNGIIAGPQTEMQSKLSDAMNSQPPIPRPNRESIFNSYNPQNNIRTANEMNANDGTKIQNQLSLDKMQLYDKQLRADEQYKKALLNRRKPIFTYPGLPDPTKQKKGGPVYKTGGATKSKNNLPTAQFGKAIMTSKNVPKKVVKKPNTGSGSGMGRMAADDAAFDAIIKKEYKAGGATKATKFAALAKPFNKATAADRIAGAKKNARKK